MGLFSQRPGSGAVAEFQNYSRSEMDLAPLQGKWDYKGSRIWINDKEIMPPVWTATHRVKSNEVPLGNENCVVRPPMYSYVRLSIDRCTATYV